MPSSVAPHATRDAPAGGHGRYWCLMTGLTLMAGTPWSAAPRTTGGSCGGCPLALPAVPCGWQLTQRGWRSTCPPRRTTRASDPWDLSLSERPPPSQRGGGLRPLVSTVPSLHAATSLHHHRDLLGRNIPSPARESSGHRSRLLLVDRKGMWGRLRRRPGAPGAS